MKIAAQICAWITLVSFTVALGWALLLAWDSVAKSRFRHWRSWLPTVGLVALSMISLGLMPVFSELAKRQAGAARASDGLMLFIFCGAAGVALLVAVSVAWILTRRGRA